MQAAKFKHQQIHYWERESVRERTRCLSALHFTRLMLVVWFFIIQCCAPATSLHSGSEMYSSAYHGNYYRRVSSFSIVWTGLYTVSSTYVLCGINFSLCTTEVSTFWCITHHMSLLHIIRHEIAASTFCSLIPREPFTNPFDFPNNTSIDFQPCTEKVMPVHD